MRQVARLWLLLGTCVVAVGLAACGSSSGGSSSASSTGGSSGSGASSTASASASTGSSSKSPITVGATLGLTGGLAYYDVAFLDGAKYAAQEFNAKGGVDGHMIKITSNDNATNLSQIVPKAQAMIATHPTLLMTSSSDTTGIPAARAAQGAGQLAMSNVGPTTYGSQLGNFVFNVSYGDPTVAAVMSEFAQQKGWKKVVLVSDQSLGYTKDVCSLFKQAFTKTNPSGVVAQATFDSTTDTSFPSQVSAIRGASGAQAVILCGLVNAAPTLIKQMRAAGVNLPIIGDDALDGVAWTKPVPNMGQFYAISIGADNPSGGSLYFDNPNPTQLAFLKGFTKQYGSANLIQDAVGGYEVVQVLAAAVEKAGGKTDSKSLAAALNTFKAVPSMMGQTTYSPSCHVAIGRPLAITQVVNHVGKYVETITPKAADTPQEAC
jgi:branched-chain amino acid transport system substrate-binding protein